MHLPPDAEKLLKDVSVSCGLTSNLGALHDAFSEAVKKARIHFLNGRELDVRNEEGDVIRCLVTRNGDDYVDIQPSRTDKVIRVDMSRGKGLEVHVLSH